MSAQPLGLEAELSEGGANLSVGQRQLLCLARVLLRAERTAILALDEASASLDHVADAALQRVIAESFKHATLVIVAHRCGRRARGLLRGRARRARAHSTPSPPPARSINTIIGCDRILVLDNGAVAEFAHPHELLTAATKSRFAMLVDEQGETVAAALRAKAAEAWASRAAR